MKALILTLTLSLSIQLVAAQSADSAASGQPQAMYNSYMAKYKTNRTIGWLLLSSGAGMMAINGINNANHGDDIFKNDFTVRRGGELGFIGTLATLTSLPFFISGGNSRKKASLSIQREKTVVGNGGAGNVRYMALALKIKF